ncbi:hypothetical protein [Streptosporangium sp. NPDC023615]|uniref:hypothetical protein n=1 Tax=Streptosporangium sp. NPDC023615 TaxID=3154794 RepID=UPI00343ED863
MREIRREDDGALLGFVRPSGEGWEPLTVFGYPLGEPRPEADALEEVHRSGLEALMGPWLFLEEGEWYRCVIVEAAADAVRVRPTDIGYPRENVLAVTLERPGPETFRPG